MAFPPRPIHISSTETLSTGTLVFLKIVLKYNLLFRGSFSVETIFTLFGFKLLFPDHFFLSRGNHESDVMNKMYGFEGEVRSKYSAKMAELFTEIFNYLPLCHLINGKIFVSQTRGIHSIAINFLPRIRFATAACSARTE